MYASAPGVSPPQDSPPRESFPPRPSSTTDASWRESIVVHGQLQSKYQHAITRFAYLISFSCSALSLARSAAAWSSSRCWRCVIACMACNCALDSRNADSCSSLQRSSSACKSAFCLRAVAAWSCSSSSKAVSKTINHRRLLGMRLQPE